MNCSKQEWFQPTRFTDSTMKTDFNLFQNILGWHFNVQYWNLQRLFIFECCSLAFHGLLFLHNGKPDSLQCLVFDFGSEMYTWSGKNVTSMRRKKAVSLALDIWNEGFDYSEALINPIHPLAGITNNNITYYNYYWLLFL